MKKIYLIIGLVLLGPNAFAINHPTCEIYLPIHEDYVTDWQNIKAEFILKGYSPIEKNVESIKIEAGDMIANFSLHAKATRHWFRDNVTCNSTLSILQASKSISNYVTLYTKTDENDRSFWFRDSACVDAITTVYKEIPECKRN